MRYQKKSNKKKIKSNIGKIIIENKLTFVFDKLSNKKIIVDQIQAIYLQNNDLVKYSFYSKNVNILLVVRRANKIIKGKLISIKNKILFKPLIAPQNQLFEISNNNSKFNDKYYYLYIIEYPQPNLKGKGEILHKKNNFDSKLSFEFDQLLFNFIISEFNLESVYPHVYIEENFKLSPQALINYRDLTSIPFVTVDGNDARDFDDAVYLKKNKNGFSLFVAIADVASYVKNGSPLDKEAKIRGNSYYLPNNVIPMLPKGLSNNICSLVPGKQRLAIVVCINYDTHANVLSSTIEHAIIKSSARLSYEQLDNELIPASKDNIDFIKNYSIHKEFSLLLSKKRSISGAIELNFSEPYFIYDTMGNIVNIKSRNSSISRKIIEQYMIEANNTVGLFCKSNKIPIFWRNHSQSTQSNLMEVSRLFKLAGIKTNRNLKHHQLNDLLLQFTNRNPWRNFLNISVLKLMKKANYSIINNGHFGLASKNYCHFTSPIRRYSDLFNHQNIKNKLQGNQIIHPSEKIAIHLSNQERVADKLEKITNLIITEKLISNKKANYFVSVTQILPFGLLIELSNPYVEGIVPLITITDDHYVFHQTKLQLRGERFHTIICIGQKLLVSFSNLNYKYHQLEFQWMAWK